MRQSRQRPPLGSTGTEHRRIKSELAQKILLEKLLADLMARFVALPSEKVNEAIEETQSAIIAALELDRSSLWQVWEDKPGLFITHQCQNPGWPPLPEMIDARVSLPWAYQKVLRGEAFSFSSIDDLPAEAASDKETFRIHGPKSNVTIPLLANGKAFGALAFATLKKERVWRADEISELKLIAEIIGNVVSRQRAELKVAQLRSEIAHVARAAALGELAATLAHEITQPLAAILANAQAAQRFLANGAIDPEELLSILGDVVRDGKRAGGIVHNLRAMLSKAPVARETCQVSEVIDEVLAFIHSELLTHKIQVRGLVAEGLPAVNVVRIELQQVLINLLLNAIQAMQKIPPHLRDLEIEAELGDDRLLISVRDHGGGIPADKPIFDPFYTTRSAGLGMGLAICRRLVEAWGGSIQARNHVEGGAVVSFSIPINDAK